MSAIIDHRYADRPVIFSRFSFGGGEDFLDVFQSQNLFGFHDGRREWDWKNYKRSHRDARASMRFFANPPAIKMHVQYLPRYVETNVFWHSACRCKHSVNCVAKFTGRRTLAPPGPPAQKANINPATRASCQLDRNNGRTTSIPTPLRSRTNARNTGTLTPKLIALTVLSNTHFEKSTGNGCRRGGRPRR